MFWLDEGLLVSNFLDRSWAGLLEPFHRGQTAPLGFLALGVVRWAGYRRALRGVYAGEARGAGRMGIDADHPRAAGGVAEERGLAPVPG